MSEPFKFDLIASEMDGAIFDIDGTLLDSMRIWGELGARCLAAFGINLDSRASAELAKVLKPMGLDEACVYLSKHYKPDTGNLVAEKLIATSLSILDDFYIHEVPLKHGAKEFLTRLHDMKIPMAVATSGEYELVDEALTREGVREYFCEIFTCGDYGMSKRTPKLFRLAAERMSTSPYRTFVFEDALYALCSAKLGGFRTVGVEDLSNLDERDMIKTLANYYVTDFAAIY